MSWTDSEVEAEALNQKEREEEVEEVEIALWDYNLDSVPVTWEWCAFAPQSYYWVHACGEKYYQLDRPSSCYLGCEED